MEVINVKQKKFAINFIFYIITFCIVCFIGIIRPRADTYTVIGDKADITVVLVSTAYGDSPFNVPKNSGYNFNQVLQIDYLVSNYQFEANKHYQLESHLTAQQLTNANYYSVSGLNGEACLISYTHSVFTGTYPRWDFQCPHATTSITLTIGNSSGQYLWNDSGIYTWTSALLSYSNTPLPSGSSDTDNIINNQNQNTQNIINNQNQNTQNIINNQNQNTQQQIESQKVCTTRIYSDYEELTISGYLTSGGSIYSSNVWRTSDYVPINSDSTLISTAGTSGVHLCFYNNDYTKISCDGVSSSGETFEIPSGSSYFRYSLRSSNSPTYRLEICLNGNQAIDDSINDLNDTLNDDDTSDAENEASEFFSSFDTETFGLTSIITAPLNLIRSVLTSNCTTLQLPLPYLDNRNLELPCMSSIYSQYFGSFFTIYQTITYGIIAYWVCVRIFNQVKDFKNPEHDEIEVMDL